MSVLTDQLRDVAVRIGYYNERGEWVNAEWMADAAERIESLERTLAQACEEHDRHHAICSAFSGNLVAKIMKVGSQDAQSVGREAE